MSKSRGEALLHLLEAYAVNTVFGIPGEHSLIIVMEDDACLT